MQNQTQKQQILLKGTLKMSQGDFLDLGRCSRKFKDEGFEILYLEARGGGQSSHYEKDKFVVFQGDFIKIHEIPYNSNNFLSFDFIIKRKTVIYPNEEKEEKEYIVLFPEAHENPLYLLKFYDVTEFHTTEKYDFANNHEYNFLIVVENESRTGAHNNILSLFLLREGDEIYHEWSSYKGRQGEGTTKYVITHELEIKELGEIDSLPLDFTP